MFRIIKPTLDIFLYAKWIQLLNFFLVYCILVWEISQGTVNCYQRKDNAFYIFFLSSNDNWIKKTYRNKVKCVKIIKRIEIKTATHIYFLRYFHLEHILFSLSYSYKQKWTEVKLIDRVHLLKGKCILFMSHSI